LIIGSHADTTTPAAAIAANLPQIRPVLMLLKIATMPIVPERHYRFN
jgi:hypothetical protein